MRKIIATFGIFVLCSSISVAQNTIAGHLQCNNLTDPLGVEAPHPTLSWKLFSTHRNVLQSAYRIIVSDNPASLQKNTGNVWDSKKVLSDASIQITYEGKALEPTKTYYWKVMVWDNTNAFAWSNPSQWQMGLINTWDWKGAKWIGYEAMPDSIKRTPVNSEWKRTPIKDVLPLIRKNIAVKAGLKKATAFVSGLGHFE